jgi:hypothetical protein
MNSDKIDQYILNSTLAEWEKQELLDVFARADDHQLRTALDEFEKDPKLITALSQNYQAKRAAFVARDGKLWNRIVEKEDLQLQAIEKAE